MKNLLILISVLAMCSSPAAAMTLHIIDNGDGTVGILNSAYSGWPDDMYFALVTETPPYPSDGYVTDCAPALTELFDDPGIPELPPIEGVWGFIGDVTNYSPPCVSINGITAPIGATIKLYKINDDWTLGPLLDTHTVGSEPNDCLNSTAAEYPDWFFLGKPDCWCYCRQCRGDINGLKTGPFWIQALDLALFRAAFNKKGDDFPAGGECADLNHKKTGPFRVGADDLEIFRRPFGHITGPPPCDQADPANGFPAPYTGPYNFWCDPGGCPAECPSY